MPKVSHLTPPLQAAPVPHDGPGHAPGALPCRYCGVIDVPTLTAGTGPHAGKACKASCAHCGRFIQWISLLAPSERLARKMKARLQAMQQHPPSQAQLDYLQALGDTLAQPATMAEASARIERLLQEKKGA